MVDMILFKKYLEIIGVSVFGAAFAKNIIFGYRNFILMFSSPNCEKN